MNNSQENASILKGIHLNLFGKSGTTLVILIWVFFIFITLLGYCISNMKKFDPLGEMTFSATLIDYDNKLKEALERKGISPGTVVHLRSKRNCLCDELANGFRDELDEALVKSGYQSVNLEMVERDELRVLIASTPSVVIVNKEGYISYVGPYAEGMSCFSGYGDDVGMIAKTVSLDGQVDAVVNTEALGCYCYE